MLQQALVKNWGLSVRRSCQLVGLSRSRLNVPYQVRNTSIRQDVLRLSYKYPRFGYRRIHALLLEAKVSVSVRQVRHIRREEGLQVKKKRKRRRKKNSDTKPPEQATAPNHVWAVDFVHDRLSRGSSIRMLTVLDECTRKSLCIRVERRLKGEDVRLTLAALFKDFGTPMYLRSDNGSEFIAACLQNWLKEENTRPLFIDPGSPWQNGKCESFNGRFRDECLNMEVFDSLAEAQLVIEGWRQHYNHERPHSALGYLTPEKFVQQWQASQSVLRKSA